MHPCRVNAERRSFSTFDMFEVKHESQALYSSDNWVAAIATPTSLITKLKTLFDRGLE